MRKLIPLMILLLMATLNISAQQNISFLITENNTAIPANVRISNEQGVFFVADSTYWWQTVIRPFHDYPSDGIFTIRLDPGKYRYEVDRGPEYNYARGEFQVNHNDTTITVAINRIVNMKKNNWWSGDLHIHRNPEHVERLMLSGDLHIGPIITSWNSHFPANLDSTYFIHPKQFDGDRYLMTSGAEDERSGGAILVFNTGQPVNFSIDHRDEYPPLAKSITRVKKEFGENSWVDVEKPFWWDMPILLPTGKVNSMGIAHNHMQRDGLLDGEAWGYPRNREQYPYPMGNGYWTQNIYYHILNSGIRIPPSAGSASGVLPNAVGYNRIYAYIDKDYSYNQWFEKVKEGKTFVTNGPLLIARANGKLPGEIFRSSKKTKIKINAEIYSRDTIDFIEIIKNGKSYKKIDPSALKGNKLKTSVTFDSSGWFLIRVINKVSGTFCFASTAPYYVEVGGQKHYISKTSVQFFLDWIENRATAIQSNSKEGDKEKEEIFEYIDAARNY